MKMMKPIMRSANLNAANPPPKMANPIYATEQHKLWRANVIKRAHGRCEWLFCGRREPRMFADHIVELRDGGSYDLANGQCLCGSHHTAKTGLAARARLESC